MNPKVFISILFIKVFFDLKSRDSSWTTVTVRIGKEIGGDLWNLDGTLPLISERRKALVVWLWKWLEWSASQEDVIIELCNPVGTGFNSVELITEVTKIHVCLISLLSHSINLSGVHTSQHKWTKIITILIRKMLSNEFLNEVTSWEFLYKQIVEIQILH